MSILFNNPRLGASGQGSSADLGDIIEQSVRFDGTQRLTRTFTNNSGNTWTWSAWLKKTSNNTRDQIIFGTGSPLQFTMARSNQFGWTQATVANFESALRRDSTAWYHRVDVSNGTNLKMYINGHLVTTWSQASTGFNTNIEHFLGGDFANRSSEMWDGYMAEIYFIDGTAVGDTDGVIDEFGRTNEDGVWVPQDYTGAFGDNGFHLDFANSLDLGNDVSGNNNDWTANGFETTDVALYTGNEAGSTSTYESNSANRTQSLSNEGSTFDGNTAGGTQVSGGGGGYWYLENKSFSSLTGLRLLWGDPSQCADIRLNGTSVSFTTSGNFTVVDTDDIPATVTEIAARRDRDNTQVLQVEINTGSGFTALLDNFDSDVDYKDTPTSNYSTLNALHARFENDLTHANLATGTNGSWQNVTGSIVVPETENWYFEYEAATVSTENRVGFADADKNPVDGGSGSQTGYWFVSSDGSVQTDGSADTSVSAWSAGDILGVQFDRDDDEVKVLRNNSSIQTWDISSVTRRIAPFFSSPGANNKANFGQMDFSHPQTDYKELQTNNLAEPTIKNGSNHFRTLTGTGANILAIAQGTNTSGTSWNDDVDTGFTNGLWWIKDRVTSNHNAGAQNQLVDSVRGSNLAITSPNNQAELSFTTPSNNSVAWCWNAGVAASANEDGSISSQVAANTDAGFSIVSYTGTSDADTVGHGLNSAPECIFVKNRDTSVNLAVFHKDINPSGSAEDWLLELQSTSSRSLAGEAWGSTAPGSSVFSVGDSDNTNKDGNDIIAYCWHSVEGYSRIGSYVGNLNQNAGTDGPFVYLGFRPAFVIFKCATNTENWQIFDSVRNTANPVNTNLSPNGTSEESTSSAFDMDFLANGFKLRNSNGNLNTLNNTFVYMAFAESPFGGENAPPATAR